MGGWPYSMYWSCLPMVLFQQKKKSFRTIIRRLTVSSTLSQPSQRRTWKDRQWQRLSLVQGNIDGLGNIVVVLLVSWLHSYLVRSFLWLVFSCFGMVKVVFVQVCVPNEVGGSFTNGELPERARWSATQRPSTVVWRFRSWLWVVRRALNAPSLILPKRTSCEITICLIDSILVEMMKEVYETF